MKTTLLCLALLGGSLAVPEGYYHQEYNYKTSASAYKNNELQHKTDDQGYYRKDGDLEGKIRPRVDSNSEHSEYVNPNSRTDQYGYGGTDLTSNGHMLAQNSYGSLGSNQLTEGVASRDHLLGGYSSDSSYGASHSYSGSSNLRSILSRLQGSLEQDLLESVRDNNYGYTRDSFDQMERELKQNMTQRIRDELYARYGQQSIRGGQSYSIANGMLQNVANYDNQELSRLQNQLETSLLDKLRSEYNQGYSSSSRYNSKTSASNTYPSGYSPTTVRPVYQTLYPTLTTPRYENYYPNRYTSNSNIRYTPVSNPESLTAIASRVQNKLDTRLNDILDEAKTKYFSSNSAYTLTNTDVVLERLRNELRGNLTYMLDEDIRRNYGNQEQRDGYYYTVGSNGQISNQQNYAVSDLDSLKSQIERNLIEKLNRDFESYKSRWSQSQSWSSSTNYGSHYYSTVQPVQRYVYTTPRYPITNQNHYGGSSSGQYDYEYGYKGSRGNSGISGSTSSGISSGSSIAQLQSKLQSDLSHQLQQALSQRAYGSYSSSGGSAGAQSYDSNLQQLRDEMNRNITRNIQEYSASGSYGAYGNFNDAQMATLKNQLESSLMRQLQQGLQQSFQTHQSYSSSSGSSGYNRPVRGFENYHMGQYKSGIETMPEEDCLGDDPNASQNHRAKRNSGPYHIRFGTGYNVGISAQSNQQEELGQQIDDSDLTQQVEDSGFGKLQVPNQNQYAIGQEEDNSDLTQQVEDIGYGKLRNQHQKPIGQQEDNSYLTQQVEDSGFGKLQIGNQNQSPVGQEEDNSDLTQQIEDSGFGNLQVGNQNRHPLGQQEDISDVTQQVEDSGFGKLEVVNQKQHPVEQQEDISDLTQQVEESEFSNLHVGNSNRKPVQEVNFGQHNTGYLNQRPTATDLTQQVEESGIRKIETEHTQQVQNTGFGSGTLGSASQVNNVDLDEIVNKLQQDISKELQKIVEHEQTSATPDLQKITRTLQTKVIIPGRLTKQQLSYVTNEVQSYIVNEIQKRFGNSYKYNIQWGTSISSVPSTPKNINTNQNIFKNISVILSPQEMKEFLDIEATLSSQLSITLAMVPSDISITELVEFEREIERQLDQNMSRLLEEKSYMFTPSKLYRIRSQLVSDLKQQLLRELNKRLHFKSAGFVPTKFTDFTPVQIQKCQDMETYLYVQLKIALSHIPLGLSNAELRYQQHKLTEELKRNITNLISNLSDEESTLFTSLQIHRIQSQLEQDLKQQLQQELQKPMIPHNAEQENVNDEIHIEVSTDIKPPVIVNQVLELTTPSSSALVPKSWNIPGFNEKQIHFCQYLEDTLTKKLTEEIEIKYTFNYSPNKPKSQVIYEQLVQELETNVTARIKGYSQHFLNSYMGFNVDQLQLIKNQLLFNLKLQLQKKIPIDMHRGDMRPDQVGPTGNQQEEIHQTQYEIGQHEEEVGQQEIEEELGQQEIEDSFEKSQLNPLNSKPSTSQFSSNPIQNPTIINTHIPSENNNPQQNPLNNVPFNRPYDFGPSFIPNNPTGNSLFRQTTREPINSNQFLQAEIGHQQTKWHNQGQFIQPISRVPTYNTNNQAGSDTALGVTSQGQIITREQTRNEAEINADSLINLLRNKQNSQDLKPVQENANERGSVDFHGGYNPRPNYNINDASYDSNTPMYSSNNPTYGNTPTNGANAPSYGANAPSYGSHTPTYTNNHPAYGSHKPMYGSHIPIYGTSTPLYGNNRELHGSSQPTYAGSKPTYGNHRPNDGSPNFDTSLNYGQQETLDEKLDWTSDVEPVQTAQAHEVTPVESSSIPTFNRGVKGRFRSHPAQEVSSSAPLENLDETATVPVEDLSWWKRFGNKVKQGASKLKEKIVG